MNPKRKIIFREALFTVPFLLVVTAATLIIMFRSGRSAYDIEQLVKDHFKSDASMDAAAFLKKEDRSYSVEYYYGDNDTSPQLYAEFEYEGGGDDPTSTLTLHEARGGFDAGVYQTVWSLGEQYVTYYPLNSSAYGEGYEKYLVGDAPLMFDLVNSYSWEGAMLQSGAGDGTKGYKLLGVKLFVWESSDNGVLRENFIWGIGGNAFEYYSYIQGSDGEYKKAVPGR